VAIRSTLRRRSEKKGKGTNDEDLEDSACQRSKKEDLKTGLRRGGETQRGYRTGRTVTKSMIPKERLNYGSLSRGFEENSEG